MELNQEQRLEKAVQHVIVFAQFAAREYAKGAEPCDLLCEAAARVFRAKEIEDGRKTPEEWVGQHFAQYMRELVLDCGPDK